MCWYFIRYNSNKWKNIEGIYLPVYLNYGYSVLRFIDNGEYEQHEIALIKNNLVPNDRVLELGTGIGFVSAYCAKITGGENVFSFEGNPDMAPLIKELYQKNKVEPHSFIAMLGEEEGEHNFYVNSDSFLASSVSANNKKQERVIPRQNLNEVIANIRPNYLVMDIEGGEYDIFTIIDFQTICKVQFELHPNMLTTTQVAFIFKKLTAANFLPEGDGHATNNFFFRRNQPLGSI